MIEWMNYLLQCSAVFTLLFLPFSWLKGDTFYNRNRFYLLGLPILSSVIPLLDFTTSVDTENGFSFMLQTVSLTPQTWNNQLVQWSFSQWISVLLITGTIALISIRLYQVWYLYLLIVRHKKLQNTGKVILVPGEKVCYSALGYIFTSADMNQPTILAHENIHILQKHHIDLLFYNVFLCLHWFNPLVWLAVKSLKAQHEYEADKLCIQSTGNKNEYQALLLSSALGCEVHALTHSFSSPTLKNRFRMMTKKQSSKWTRLKTLAIIPFAAIAVAAFSISCNNATEPDVALHKQEGKTPDDGDMVMPEYPGGTEAMVKYLADNIKYPESAVKDSISGKVYVAFTVQEDGSVTDVNVKRGLTADCDKEAMRVISSMPKWKPATKKGKPAAATLTLPIQFKLN